MQPRFHQSVIRPVLFAALAFAVVSPLNAEVPRGTYRGTAATTVNFLHPITNVVTATRRYSRKITVTIGAPAPGETNQFSLNVKPTIPGPAPVAGDFYTASARFVTFGGSTQLLQYWSLVNTADGFTGKFTRSYLPEGFAIDRLVAPLVRPSGALKPHRFHDARVSPALQVTAEATIPEERKIALTIDGYAFVPNQAGVQFTTSIKAKKPTPPTPP
jgi:hypothetical protein